MDLGNAVARDWFVSHDPLNHLKRACRLHIRPPSRDYRAEHEPGRAELSTDRQQSRQEVDEGLPVEHPAEGAYFHGGRDGNAYRGGVNADGFRQIHS